MAEKTGISWATHTWNPWLGCTKAHTGCANCYAEKLGGRLGVTWGPGGARRRTADSTWGQVERWHRRALNWEAACVLWNEVAKDSPMGHCVLRHDRPRVFSSMCDWFEVWGGPMLGSNGMPLYVPCCDNPHPNDPADHRQVTMADVRCDAFAVVDRCPGLDFLIATKRPENVRGMWSYLDGDTTGRVRAWMAEGESQEVHSLFRKNVWLGYSASDQATLDAGLPHLLACRDLVPVLWLSIEPLVGPVDLGRWLGDLDVSRDEYGRDLGSASGGSDLDWVVVGGESGPDHRPCDVEWIDSIVAQCKAAGVPCWVKQDCGVKPGQQGQIPDRLWNVKELPR